MDVSTACVTGADRGVGYSLTAELLRLGYTVFAGQYDKDWTLLETLKEQYPAKLQIMELDISDDRSVAAAKQIILEGTDSLDLLINNAAVLGDIESTIVDELDFEQMKQVFDVNTLGPLRVSHALLPLLLKGKEKLIANISSEAGSIGDCWRSSWFAYCMSKTALNMQSQLIHNKFKEAGGQVMVLHPGWVQTYMQGKLDEQAAITPDQSAAQLLKLIQQHEQFQGESAVFIDETGKLLPW